MGSFGPVAPKDASEWVALGLCGWLVLAALVACLRECLCRRACCLPRRPPLPLTSAAVTSGFDESAGGVAADTISATATSAASRPQPRAQPQRPWYHQQFDSHAFWTRSRLVAGARAPHASAT